MTVRHETESSGRVDCLSRLAGLGAVVVPVPGAPACDQPAVAAGPSRRPQRTIQPWPDVRVGQRDREEPDRGRQMVPARRRPGPCQGAGDAGAAVQHRPGRAAKQCGGHKVVAQGGRSGRCRRAFQPGHGVLEGRRRRAGFRQGVLPVPVHGARRQFVCALRSRHADSAAVASRPRQVAAAIGAPGTAAPGQFALPRPVVARRVPAVPVGRASGRRQCTVAGRLHVRGRTRRLTRPGRSAQMGQRRGGPPAGRHGPRLRHSRGTGWRRSRSASDNGAGPSLHSSTIPKKPSRHAVVLRAKG